MPFFHQVKMIKLTEINIMYIKSLLSSKEKYEENLAKYILDGALSNGVLGKGRIDAFKREITSLERKIDERISEVSEFAEYEKYEKLAANRLCGCGIIGGSINFNQNTVSRDNIDV